MNDSHENESDNQTRSPKRDKKSKSFLQPLEDLIQEKGKKVANIFRSDSSQSLPATNDQERFEYLKRKKKLSFLEASKMSRGSFQSSWSQDEETYPFPPLHHYEEEENNNEYSPVQLIPSHQEKFRCQFCSLYKVGKRHEHQVFICGHVFCRECLLDQFKTKIELGTSIERFECLGEYCRASAQPEDLLKIIPEIELPRFEKVEELGECGICFEVIRGSEKDLKIFECNTHYFCYSCTLDMVKQCIADRKVLDLTCPCGDCKAPTNEEALKKLIPARIFNNYKRLKDLMLIERDPNVRWCSAHGCQKILRGTREKPKLDCSCGHSTCLLCGSQWHGKKSCEQVLKEEMKAYAKLNHVQLCPECKTRTIKRDGCNHITCPICTYEWCWLCRKEYSSKHYEWSNPFGCPGEMYTQNYNASVCLKKTCKIFSLFLLGILIVILSPLGIIFGAIATPCLWYSEKAYNPKCFIQFLLVIVGLLTFPLTIALALVALVVPGSCYFMIVLVDYCKKRSREKRRRKQLIQERLARTKNDERDWVPPSPQINLEEDPIEVLTRGLLIDVEREEELHPERQFVIEYQEIAARGQAFLENVRIQIE